MRADDSRFSTLGKRGRAYRRRLTAPTWATFVREAPAHPFHSAPAGEGLSSPAASLPRPGRAC